MQHVLIYRSELLAYSETFIAAQAAAMRHFSPVFAGLRRVQSSLSLPGPSFVLTAGNSLQARLRRYAFRRTGYGPSLLEKARACRPVLVHAHFALDAAEALPLVFALHTPLVVTLHGYDVMARDEMHRRTRAGRIYLARQRQLFSRASLFICVSEAIRLKAIERGYPPEKLRVHAIGIDVTRYARRNRISPEPLILFVGRLVEKKGCAHLIRAMRTVQEVLPRARLVVIGEGPERSRLAEQARRWAPGTVFLGVQSGGEVKHWMERSRVLAAPSIAARSGDAEGLPMVLCEALAMGLPVASFRSSGIPELVRDGLEGLLSEEGDEAGLAASLLRLCQDDALALRLSLAGRRRVEQNFELGAQTAALETLYMEVLAAAKPEAEERTPCAPPAPSRPFLVTSGSLAQGHANSIAQGRASQGTGPWEPRLAYSQAASRFGLWTNQLEGSPHPQGERRAGEENVR